MPAEWARSNLQVHLSASVRRCRDAAHCAVAVLDKSRNIRSAGISPAADLAANGATRFFHERSAEIEHVNCAQSLRPGPPARQSPSACKASSYRRDCTAPFGSTRSTVPSRHSHRRRSVRRDANAYLAALPGRPSPQHARCHGYQSSDVGFLLRTALAGRRHSGDASPGISCQADGTGPTGRKSSGAVNARRPNTRERRKCTRPQNGNAALRFAP